MSNLMKRNTPLKQFQVVGATPATADIFPMMSEALSKFSFRHINESLEQSSIGWTRADDLDKANFNEPGRLHIGNFLFFSLRRDTRNVPAAVLNMEVKAACEQFLADNPGFHRVPKKKREDIKDAVKLSLLAKTLPVPSVFDVAWDLEKGIITIATASNKMIDIFEVEFRKTFGPLGFQLRTMIPYRYAEYLTLKCSRELYRQLQQHNLASTEAVLDQIRANEWIGQEFLLWVLTGGARDFNDLSVWIDDRLVMIGKQESGIQKITVAGDVQERLPTIRAALGDGKKITAATLYVQNDASAEGDIWKISVTADMFTFNTFMTPTVMMEKGDHTDELSEFQAYMLEKIHLVNKGHELFMTLFSLFLKERLTDMWVSRMGKIIAWVNDEEEEG